MDYFEQLIEGVKYALPAIVTGYTTYYFLDRFFRREEKKQILQAKQELQKFSLPIRLQAYERLALFLERISPVYLVKNIYPDSEEKNKYVEKLVFQIESEFEHNLSQQIYVTTKCWNVIVASKNATIFFIRNTAQDEDLNNAFELQKAILTKAVEKGVPTETGLEFLRNEASDLF
jgi:hypothetical protein